MRAIRVQRFGGPEVLEPAEIDEPIPGEGEILLDVSAAGVNYADTHQTEDSYLAKQSLPLVPGAEAVGTTPDGRRVVALLANGGYAERAVAHPAMCFPVPDGVEDGEALAVVLQGATAWHLLRTCAHLADGESVVVHAAAGGVGTIAVQLAKRWGAGRVIAVASTDAKRELALELGADVAVPAGGEGLQERLIEANGGRHVDIVLEMTGGPTTDASLAALAPLGRLVFFGMASRVPPSPADLGALMRRSLAVVGFWLAHAMKDPQRLLAGPIDELLTMVARGELRAVVGATYALTDAAQAHRDLRDRSTVGKLVLDPKR